MFIFFSLCRSYKDIKPSDFIKYSERRKSQETSKVDMLFGIH